MAIITNLKTLAPARDRFKREIVLLSHGFSMREQLPGGKITVYPWDQTIDDWVIRNLKKIKLATMPFEIAKKLVNIPDIKRLPAGDVTTILLVAKAAARDSTVTYTSVCPACGHTAPVTIKVPEQLLRVGEKTDDYPGWDEFKLPAAGDLMRVRPLLVQDELALIDRADEQLAPVQAGTIPPVPMSMRLSRAITHLISVNGGVPDTVEEAATYFNALQPSDFDFFLDSVASIEPHLGTDLTHVCDKCSTKFVHSLALDSEFFR
jgi:hypothetical protein